MLGYGRIRGKGRAKSLDLGLWRAIIKTTPFLRRARPFRGLNPFTKQELFHPKPDCAEVVVDGESYGELIWGEDAIYLDGDSTVLTPIACQIAEALNGVAEDDEGDRLVAPADWTLESAVAAVNAELEASRPRGRWVPVLKYPGTFDLELWDFLGTSGEKWSEFAKRIGLPEASNAKRGREQYDHFKHTNGSKETETVHHLEDRDHWVIRACVSDDKILQIGRGPPPQLTRQLRRADRKRPKR